MKNKIKVLHVIGSGSIGGAENFVYQLAAYQHVHGGQIDPGICFRKGKGHFVEKTREAGIRLLLCKEKIDILHFKHILSFFKTYDVIHFHGLYPILFLAAFLSRKHIFYYIHGVRSLTKSASDVIKEIGRKKFPSMRGIKRLLKRQLLVFFLKRLVHKIHAPSRYYVDLYEEKYGIPRSSILKLPLGVDFTRLDITNSRNKVLLELGIEDQVVIGCVSTFRKLKRIDRLIDAFAIVSQSTEKVKLLIVGDGEERTNLEKRIADHGLNHKVILSGMRNDVSNLLNVMDFFVLASEFESFSIAIVEAMFFRKPVIAFKGSGGAEEIVKESEGGILVQDVKELATAMNELIKNKNTRILLSEKGHNFVINNYNMERFHSEMCKQYRAEIETLSLNID